MARVVRWKANMVEIVYVTKYSCIVSVIDSGLQVDVCGGPDSERVKQPRHLWTPLIS